MSRARSPGGHSAQGDILPSDTGFALYDLTLAVAVFIFHDKLYVNTHSVELPARDVHATIMLF